MKSFLIGLGLTFGVWAVMALFLGGDPTYSVALGVIAYYIDGLAFWFEK